jgi:ABC-type uncharacterized transport system substrate-binding protein
VRQRRGRSRRARSKASECRRIGVLVPQDQDSPVAQARIAALLQELRQLGWTGRNARIDIHWAGADAENIRKHAAELATLAPDVILANGTSAMGPLQQATRSLPIVFVNVADPVNSGFIASLARPGGNATGFSALEYSFGGKLLEMLKQISPGVTRAAVIRDPSIASGSGQLGAIQAVGPFLGVGVSPIDARSDIERAVTDFARSPNGGLIVPASTPVIVRRELIITTAPPDPAVRKTRTLQGCRRATSSSRWPTT